MCVCVGFFLFMFFAFFVLNLSIVLCRFCSGLGGCAFAGQVEGRSEALVDPVFAISSEP